MICHFEEALQDSKQIDNAEGRLPRCPGLVGGRSLPQWLLTEATCGESRSLVSADRRNFPK